MNGEIKTSLLVACVGSDPERALRSIHSAIEARADGEVEIHLATTLKSASFIAELRRLYDRGLIDTYLLCHENLNPVIVQRVLLDRAESDQIIWIDDSVYLLPGWLQAVREFIGHRVNFDVAGSVSRERRDAAYEATLRAQPWFHSPARFAKAYSDWAGVDENQANRDSVCLFPDGRFWIGQVSYLRKYDFPGRDLLLTHRDKMFGDLIAQTQARFVILEPTLAKFLRAHGDGSPAAIDGMAPESSTIASAPPKEAARQDRSGEALRGRALHLKNNPPPTCSQPKYVILNNQANELCARGLYAQALEQYLRALGLAPKVAEIHYNIANVLRVMKRAEEALGYYETALALKSDYADAFNNYGITLFQLGRFEEAVNAYSAAAKLTKNSAATYYNLGNAYENLGRRAEARKAFERALEINPDLAQARERLRQLKTA